MTPLDLYAQIESMIGFDEAYDELYQRYLQRLDRYAIESLLDLGCGNGNFLLQAQERYRSTGIDLSPKMVEIAQAKGVDARCMALEDLDMHFDAITAIGDVLNYIHPRDLPVLFAQISQRLNTKGLFLCDLNTLHGFEDVTSGTLAIDEGDRFVSIDAEFVGGVLGSEMVYFEKKGECFTKYQGTIFQYHHEIEELAQMSDLALIDSEEITMFSDEADKVMAIFQKST